MSAPADQEMSEQDDIREGLPSASSFHIDVSCAGRQNLLRSMREQGIADADDLDLKELSERGERIHSTRATRFTFRLKDDGELDAYKKGCALEKQLVEAWTESFGITQYTEASLERLWLHNPVTMEPILSGEVDILFTAGRHAAIVDWKSSAAYYVPPANRSWQLRCYAVLVWREYEGIENIRVAYVMPERFGERLDYSDLTSFDLQRIESEIFQVLWRSKQPDAQLNAGAHCRFCPARGICPAAAKMASLPAVTSNGDPLALVKAMPVEDLAVVFRKRGQVNAIFEAIINRLSALSDEKLSEIGLKRTAGKKLDKIKDVAGVAYYLRGRGMSEGSLYAAMSFGKEKLVKLVADTWGMSEEHAAERLDRELDEFIERGRGKPSLIDNT